MGMGCHTTITHMAQQDVCRVTMTINQLEYYLLAYGFGIRGNNWSAIKTETFITSCHEAQMKERRKMTDLTM